eukprot:SAG31_NODE_3717_length_3952_cov_8.633424_1_plen_467_part_00
MVWLSLSRDTDGPEPINRLCCAMAGVVVPGVYAVEVGACRYGWAFVFARQRSSPVLKVLGLSEVAVLFFLLATIGHDAADILGWLSHDDLGVHCAEASAPYESCEMMVMQSTKVVWVVFCFAVSSAVVALVIGVCWTTSKLVDSYGHSDADRKSFLPPPRVLEGCNCFQLLLWVFGFPFAYGAVVIFILCVKWSENPLDPPRPMFSSCRFGRPDYSPEGGCCAWNTEEGPFCAEGRAKIQRLPPTNDTRFCREGAGLDSNQSAGYHWYECVLAMDEDSSSGSAAGFFTSGNYTASGSSSGSFSLDGLDEDRYWETADASFEYLAWYLFSHASVLHFAGTGFAFVVLALVFFNVRPYSRTLGLRVTTVVAAVLSRVLLDAILVLRTRTPNLLAGLIDDVLGGNFTSLRTGYTALRPGACDGLDDKECRSTTFGDAAHSEFDASLHFAVVFVALYALTLPAVLVYKQD